MTWDFIHNFQKTKNRNIVDLCCGSGVIGITLKKYLPIFQVSCIDKYFRRIINTKLNAQKLKNKSKDYKTDVFKYLVK